jgi:hypothetical protein
MKQFVIRMMLPDPDWTTEFQIEHVKEIASALRRTATALDSLCYIPKDTVPIWNDDCYEIGTMSVEEGSGT